MERLLTKFQTLHPLYLATALFVFTFIVYASTLANGLLFDDEQFIYENASVQNFSVPEFFSHSLISESGRLSNYYRPLLFLTFGVEYQLVGDTGFLYHASSMLIHIAGGIVLFLFLYKLFLKRNLAFLVSLLWLIHPIQTEAVSYASGRGDPLSFFFVVLTLYLAFNKTKRFTLFALISFIFALLSKELAIITPGLIFLAALIKQRAFTVHSLWKSFLFSLPFLFIALIYFVLRITTLDFANTLNFYNSENVYTNSLFVRLNTFSHLLPEYIKLLFFPKDLFMERDLLISIQTKLTLFSVTAFASVITLIIVGIKKLRTSPVILFAVGWFVITFIPTSGIIPINGIFYEHFLYYPSVGFFLLISFLFLELLECIPKLRWIFFSAFSLVVLLLCIRTIVRNSDWHDPIRFYETTNTYVQSPRIYNNLAMSYADQGSFEKAIPLYQKAIRLSDTYPQTHFNLANAYVQKREFEKAEKEYKESLRLDPAFYLAHISLYKLYTATNNERGKQYIKEELEKLSKQNTNFHLLLKELETL